MSDVKVTLTLPKWVAEKLRAKCHERGQTASDYIGQWVAGLDQERPPTQEEQREANLRDFVEGVLGGRR